MLPVCGIAFGAWLVGCALFASGGAVMANVVLGLLRSVLPGESDVRTLDEGQSVAKRGRIPGVTPNARLHRLLWLAFLLVASHVPGVKSQETSRPN